MLLTGKATIPRKNRSSIIVSVYCKTIADIVYVDKGHPSELKIVYFLETTLNIYFYFSEF